MLAGGLSQTTKTSEGKHLNTEVRNCCTQQLPTMEESLFSEFADINIGTDEG